MQRSTAVVVGDADQAGEIAAVNKFERVVEKCWPGALTLVLNRLDDANVSVGRASVDHEGGRVSVRCSDNAFVRMLAPAVGLLARTSVTVGAE